MLRAVGRTLFAFAVLGIAAFALAPSGADAQQLVYRPTNPAFGGNPHTGQWLLSVATAQKETPENDYFSQDPLAEFQAGLQRQILAAISQEIIDSRFGGGLDLTKQGRYDLGEFIVEVLPGSTGVQVNVTNTLTGGQTTVTVPSF